MTEETSRQVLPRAIGFAARQAIVALHKHNVPIAPLLKRAGISEGGFDNLSVASPPWRKANFLSTRRRRSETVNWGCTSLSRPTHEKRDCCSINASAAEDIGDALALLARYCRISNEAVRVKLTRSPEGVTAEAKYVGLPRQFAWQNTEFLIAILVKGLREMAGRDFRPVQVAFTLARNSELREFERFFDCRVEFSASADQFVLSNETLALPLVTEDHHLLEALRPICEEAAKERNTALGSLRASVENEVQKLLPHGRASRQRVAKALGLSERTLSQRLAEEDTSYDQVVDRLRQSLALQYVKEPSLSLAQIAWLLGYEGPTSFNYAFARWTGMSASEARNEKQRPKV